MPIEDLKEYLLDSSDIREIASQTAYHILENYGLEEISDTERLTDILTGKFQFLLEDYIDDSETHQP